MKNKIVVWMLVMSMTWMQVACSAKFAKIETPLEKAEFSKEYKYNVLLKKGGQISGIYSDQMKVEKNTLQITTPKENKSVMDSEISHINGAGFKRTGSYVGEGAAIGASAGLIFFLAMSSDVDENDEWGGFDEVVGAMGLITGTLLGLVVGLTIPKYNRVQITPIISPTANSMETGINVGVNF